MDGDLARLARFMETFPQDGVGLLDKSDRNDEEMKKQKERSDRIDQRLEVCHQLSQKNEELLGTLRKTIDESIRSRGRQKE